LAISPPSVSRLSRQCGITDLIASTACHWHRFTIFTIYITTLGISLLEILNSFMALVRFEVFTAATMKNCVFWDVTPCDSCRNRRIGGT
jgi:hypothetical protein